MWACRGVMGWAFLAGMSLWGPFSPFFFVAGAVLGLVFSVTLVSGTVWTVQMALRRGLSGGLAAGFGIALAQGLLGGVAAGVIFYLQQWHEYLDWPLRIASSGLFLWLARDVMQAGRIARLHFEGPVGSAWGVLMDSFEVALRMPMRLPGFMALLVAVSLHLRPQSLSTAVVFAVGVCGGSMVWWLYFALLAKFFGHRVPEDISLRSLNKLRMLSLAVFLGLIVICLLPAILV